MTEKIRSSHGLGPTETIQISNWPLRSGKRRTLANEAHVWCLLRSSYKAKLSQLQSYLSVWEQRKAMSFSYEKDREDFIVGRGILRHLLSQYLGCYPAEVEITNNRYGKPFVKGPVDDIQFNVAQSANVQVFSFVRNRQIGIDVELIDSDVNYEELMLQNFSVSEIHSINDLPEYSKVYGFYKTWTQKEAFIKANGLGYELSSKSFCVETDPQRDGELISVYGQKRMGQFKMYQLPILSSFSCSLAIEEPKISCLRQYRIL